MNGLRRPPQYIACRQLCLPLWPAGCDMVRVLLSAARQQSGHTESKLLMPRPFAPPHHHQQTHPLNHHQCRVRVQAPQHSSAQPNQLYNGQDKPSHEAFDTGRVRVNEVLMRCLTKVPDAIKCITAHCEPVEQSSGPRQAGHFALTSSLETLVGDSEVLPSASCAVDCCVEASANSVKLRFQNITTMLCKSGVILSANGGSTSRPS